MNNSHMLISLLLNAHNLCKERQAYAFYYLVFTFFFSFVRFFFRMDIERLVCLPPPRLYTQRVFSVVFVVVENERALQDKIYKRVFPPKVYFVLLQMVCLSKQHHHHHFHRIAQSILVTSYI